MHSLASTAVDELDLEEHSVYLLLLEPAAASFVWLL